MRGEIEFNSMQHNQNCALSPKSICTCLKKEKCKCTKYYYCGKHGVDYVRSHTQQEEKCKIPKYSCGKCLKGLKGEGDCPDCVAQPKPFNWNKIGTVKEDEKPWEQEFEKIWFSSKYPSDVKPELLKLIFSLLAQQKATLKESVMKAMDKTVYQLRSEHEKNHTDNEKIYFVGYDDAKREVKQNILKAFN